jgi:glycosyltransferase EpsD
MHLNRVMFYKFLTPVIEAQRKRGHYVCVCTADGPEVKQLRNKGIDVFVHELKRSLSPLNILKAIHSTRKILIEERIDVLICHTPVGSGVGRLAARLTKTQHVIYFAHGLPFAPAQNPLIWFLWFGIEKTLGLFTDAILVMNDYDERLAVNYLVRNPDKVFRVSGMGVDLTKFNMQVAEKDKQQIYDEFNISPDQKIVLCVASLKPTKGVFVFLQAAKQICIRRSDIYFLLAGVGPAKKRLKTLCAKYNLEDHFKILGLRDDIHRLLQAADIFVLPSYYFEGLPVSILEAMACGKPVVSTKHRGCEDAVEDKKTGFLVPVKQVTPLVNKISMLLDSPELRQNMGRAGRQRAERCFELNHCTEKIVKAIETACEES